MAITTAMCNSFKRDLMSGLFCFNATVTPTANTHTNTTVDTLSAGTGIAVGMAVSGSGVAANTFVSQITSSTAIVISIATSSTLTGTTLTFTGDVFKLALIKVAPAGTYNNASTGYSDITGNTDEVSGTGYTAGGNTLTNTSPSLSTNTATVTFANTSWTSSSFSTTGCMIYDSTQRGCPKANPATSVHDFGGTQTVSSGTFTLVFPTNDASNAILRIA